jgi:hypothetical protein
MPENAANYSQTHQAKFIFSDDGAAIRPDQ